MNVLRTALFAATTLFATAAIADEAGDVRPLRMRVVTDQSTLLRLDRPAKTVIVGNPSIADVQLINERTIYVLGRMFGNTNIIAVDSQGVEVVNAAVVVTAGENNQVTLYRGPGGQRNLACSPQCERTLMPGDPEMAAIIQDADKKSSTGQKAAALSAGK